MQKGKEPKITRSNDISFDRPRNRAHSGAHQGSSQSDSETFSTHEKHPPTPALQSLITVLLRARLCGLRKY